MTKIEVVAGNRQYPENHSKLPSVDLVRAPYGANQTQTTKPDLSYSASSQTYVTPSQLSIVFLLKTLLIKCDEKMDLKKTLKLLPSSASKWNHGTLTQRGREFNKLKVTAAPNKY